MPIRRPHRLHWFVLALAPLAGCPARDVAKIDPTEARVLVRDVPISDNRDLDVLFVIDNSLSMADKQQSLVTNFHQFIDVLESIPGGLPNVHIGVTSSDVGTGGQAFGGCTGSGDDGRLQSTPRGGACSAPSGDFLSDTANADGTRAKNYTGSLSDSFTCIARLGDQGCGMEQHLEGMKRALDGHNPATHTFLRPDAYLAVVILGDEDDCSAADASLFDPNQKTVADPLGPVESFRCTEFGIECCDGGIAEGDATCVHHKITRDPAAYSNCRPITHGHYLFDVEHYVTFLRNLKVRPDDQLIVSVIGGDPTPFSTSLNAKTTHPQLDHSCHFQGPNGLEVADPGIRFRAFADAFPHGALTSICNADLSVALTELGQRVGVFFGSPCLVGDLDTTDVHPELPGLQLDCEVTDILDENTDHESQTLVPRCPMQDDRTPAANAPVPCWYAAVDTTTCTAPNEPTHLALVVKRAPGATPIGTHERVSCVAK